MYYYLVNAQGDVVGLIDSTGALVVQYTYDAWGRLLSTTGTAASTLGINNPLRYRGYIYDHETGLYYLQSRYYNPTWGRFINADNRLIVPGAMGINLFAYCNNNPIYYVDPYGTDSAVAEWWASTMWCLCGADGALPIGELVYLTGWLLLGCATYEYAPDILSDLFSDEDVKVGGGSYKPPSPDDDDDDDYYADDRNHATKEKIGRCKGNAPRNNQKQNAQARHAAKKAGVKLEKMELLHDEISGQGFSYQEICEVAKTLALLVLVFF